jgi:hypothetical protein
MISSVVIDLLGAYMFSSVVIWVSTVVLLVSSVVIWTFSVLTGNSNS